MHSHGMILRLPGSDSDLRFPHRSKFVLLCLSCWLPNRNDSMQQVEEPHALDLSKGGTTHLEEGRRFRCTKCPMRFGVLGGLMCAFEPNQPLHLAHRPDISFEHQTKYHTDDCSLEPDGRLPPDFISQERSRAEALTKEEMDVTRALLKVFSVGIERLLRVLQTFSGVTCRLESHPELSGPRRSFVPRPCNFNLLAIRALHEPWLEARIAREELRGSVRELCQKLQFVRILQQLACQKLHGKCLGTVLSFLGSASYLPTPGEMLSFSLEEVEVPQPDLGFGEGYPTL